MSLTLSLDKSGRILIPAELRSRLGLAPGMTLIVENGDSGEVWLRPQPESPVLVEKEGVLVVKAEPLDDLTDIARHERDHHVSDLLEQTGL